MAVASLAFCVFQVPDGRSAPPSLESMKEWKELYEKSVESSSDPLFKEFAAKLEKLERAAVAEGDYETALAIKEKRQHLGEFANTTESRFSRWSMDHAIVVDLGDSRRSGSVQWTHAKKFLGRWKTTGSDVKWDLRSLSPGTYTVEVTYSCGQATVSGGSGLTHEVQAAGRFEFSETTGLLGRSAPIVHEVKPTADWKSMRTERIGKIAFKGNIARISLRAVVTNEAGLMQLYRLRLIPDDPAMIRASSGDFFTLRRKFHQSLREKTAGRKRQYIAELESLRERALNAEQFDLVAKIDGEIKDARDNLKPGLDGG